MLPNRHAMELYQLRSFAAVAEAGHLTRAAERLHVSQPAVSAQIRSLEEELGAALFERTATGMTLTQAGARLLPLALRVIAAAADMKAQALSLKGEVAGHLRVGTLADPETLRLGDLLARAVERHPLLQIELHHEVTGAAFAKVRDGALDASFYYGPLHHPAVASLALRPLAYRVAVPAAWRDRIAADDWASIAALPWVTTPPISSHHALAAQLFADRGTAPATIVEADHESVVRSLVIAGVGAGLMREDLALESERAGEALAWPGARLETPLQFIHARERTPDPAVAALVALVADTWRDGHATAAVANDASMR
ncbi:Hca operon transcriptional activator HcaR [Burkholderiales bacterium]|nr:Hca operon transcriptional activator HcaR [Burkholderiales bacterium]